MEPFFRTGWKDDVGNVGNVCHSRDGGTHGRIINEGSGYLPTFERGILVLVRDDCCELQPMQRGSRGKMADQKEQPARIWPKHCKVLMRVR